MINILTLCLFLTFPEKISIRNRIVYGLLGLIAIFVLATVMPLWKSLSPTLYFYFTLLLISGSSVCVANISAMYGLASTYPSLCLTGINSGQGIAGVIPSILLLFQQAKGKAVDLPGLTAYFCTTIIIFLLALVGYIVLPKADNQVYEEVEDEDITGSVEQIEGSDLSVEILNPELSTVELFSLIKIPIFCVTLNYFITLSLFPAVTSGVESFNKAPLFVIYHFIFFNVGDWLGKSVTGFSFISSISEKSLLIFTLLRLLYIPAVLACNLILYNEAKLPYPRHDPVLFGDGAFYFIVFTLAFTNGNFNLTTGLLTTNCFISASGTTIKKYGNNYKLLSVGGDLMVLSLTFGLAFGTLFAFIWEAISCRCNPF
ncbi:hypothetical protein HDV01_001416 [Terramyces sp. JEL0728]|nr:hypothetical protein HDV01_001416 [Terramyces sp. JEL0728]